MQLRRWSGVANNAVVQRRMVLCRAAKPEGKSIPCKWMITSLPVKFDSLRMVSGGLSVGNVMKALGTAKSAWDRADHDKNGTLSLDETVVLINRQVCHTNVSPLQRD
jgi:hypothetical protein